MILTVIPAQERIAAQRYKPDSVVAFAGLALIAADWAAARSAPSSWSSARRSAGARETSQSGRAAPPNWSPLMVWLSAVAAVP